MRRTIPLLTVILALQIGLAALLAVRKDPLAATTPQTPLIDTSLQTVDHLLIEGHTSGPGGAAAGGAAASAPSAAGPTLAKVELAKQDGNWVLPGYFNAPVDKFKLNDVLDELSDLKRGLPVATTSSALKRFQVVDDNFQRRLTLSSGKKVLSTVYFGSSAGARKTDARTANDHAVYDVDLATYELPTQPSEWFDAGLLETDAGALSQLDVTADGQPTIELQHQVHSAASASPAIATPTAAAGKAGAVVKADATAKAGAAATTSAGATTSAAAADAAGTKIWVDPSLPAGRQVDGAHVDALARDIADLRVDGILGLSAQPQWQQDRPLLTLAIHNDKHPGQVDTWTLSQPLPDTGNGAAAHAGSSGSASEGGRNARGAAGAKAGGPDYYVLKDSARPWYFKVSAATGKQLIADGAPTALLTSQQSSNQPAAHTGPANRGASRAHRRRHNAPRT